MPTTLTSLLVILVAIIPGVLGEGFYRIIVGANWREGQWNRVIRIIGIGLFGFVLYLLAVSLINFLPFPDYVFPGNFSSDRFSATLLQTMAAAYVCHTIAASLVGLFVGGMTRLITKHIAITTYPDSWDSFVRILVRNHWVIVHLENGETFAGIMYKADTSVQQPERDIILEEPALFDKKSEQYISLPYQHLFLPGALISSVAVYYNETDHRLSNVNQPLFEEKSDGKENQPANK